MIFKSAKVFYFWANFRFIQSIWVLAKIKLILFEALFHSKHLMWIHSRAWKEDCHDFFSAQKNKQNDSYMNYNYRRCYKETSFTKRIKKNSFFFSR